MDSGFLDGWLVAIGFCFLFFLPDKPGSGQEFSPGRTLHPSIDSSHYRMQNHKIKVKKENIAAITKNILPH